MGVGSQVGVTVVSEFNGKSVKKVVHINIPAGQNTGTTAWHTVGKIAMDVQLEAKYICIYH